MAYKFWTKNKKKERDWSITYLGLLKPYVGLYLLGVCAQDCLGERQQKLVI